MKIGQKPVFTLILSIVLSQSVIAKDTLPFKKSGKGKSQTKAAPIVKEANRKVPGIVNVHSIGLGIGQTFLWGEFEANGDDRITGDIFYTYSASYTFDVLVNLHYSEHKFRNRDVKIAGTAVGIKGRIFQMDSFSPYLLGGLGFYRPKTTRIMNGGPLTSEDKLTFGSHFGAGADLRLNRNFTVGLLGHVHNPFDVKQEQGTQVEGSYFKLLMTMMYSF